MRFEISGVFKAAAIFYPRRLQVECNFGSYGAVIAYETDMEIVFQIGDGYP